MKIESKRFVLFSVFFTVIIVLSLLFYFLFSYRIDFSEIVSSKTQTEISLIKMRAGFNGVLYEASSKEEMDGFWKILNKYKYRRKLLNPVKDGYQFVGNGYRGEEQKISISIVDGIGLKGRKYKPSNDLIYTEIQDYIEHGGFHRVEN